MLGKALVPLLSLAIYVSATCAPIPDDITPVANAKLPDPFALLEGGRVSNKAEWACRHEQISQLVQRFEVGSLPPPPESVVGAFTTEEGVSKLNVTVTDNGKTTSFSARITFPEDGEGPFPAIIGVGYNSLPAIPGVATILFPNDEIAQQWGAQSRGIGKFFDLYGADHSAGATLAWTWGISRLIDALESTTGHNIDATKLGVTGCSRNGKGAFTVGAFEPRIALTIPQESGAGGSAAWRISDAEKRAGINIQTASQIITENVWLSTRFNPFVNKVDDLPHDRHFFPALIAPRGLYVIENDIDWLGPASTWGNQVVGRKVYEALGVADNHGISVVGDHSHCAIPESQVPELVAFVDKFLKGDSTADTAIVHNDGDDYGFVEENWVDWTVPDISA